MKRTPRTAPVAMALFIMFVAVALAVSNHALEAGFWTRLSDLLARSALQFDFYTVPSLVVLGVMYAYKRESKFGIAFMALIVLNSVILVASVIAPRPSSIRAETSVDYAINIAQNFTTPSVLVPAMVMFAFRFRGRLERVRIAAIVFIVTLPVFLSSIYWMPIRLFDYLEMIVFPCYVGILIWAAWCIAFRRQDAPHRPPADSARVIALACPRCGTAQNIAAGHGECGNCRLKISISLEEGACGHCRYPLRGLTGEKCPECGTKFASPAGPQPEAAAAASESVVSDSSTIAP